MKNRQRAMKVLFLFICLLITFPSPVFAQSKGGVPSPVVLVLVLGGLSLAPFVLIMLTSFTKIAVVLSLLRNALGTQQTPPTPVITGLAFVLTIFIMAPVGQAIYKKTEGLKDTSKEMFSEATIKYLFEAAKEGREPVREFLLKHSHAKDRALFLELARRMQKNGNSVDIGPKDFQVIIPAFVISQLKDAFLIGFLIFIPFIVIDMVVSNILMSMGMMMLSPVTISLPFKLLLFVLVDGWYLIVRGLVLGYA